MDDREELAEQMEWLLDQVETVQRSLERLQSQLTACGEGLRGKLADLRAEADLPARLTPAPGPRERETPRAPQAPASATSPGQERRATPRRRGNPISVRVANPQMEGWVVDRSPDGFSLLADVKVAAGSLLSVCPAQNLDNPRWFQVEVRSCRAKGKNWILGCQFAQKLSWKELRLFG
jgi:hypothetical protein